MAVAFMALFYCIHGEDKRVTMKELLEYLARKLVDHPEGVEVEELEGDRSTILELRVDPDDMGRVIGRQGRVAQALRALVKAAAARDGSRVTVEIV